MAEGIESLANPEDLEAARQASAAMADIEFMAEQQNILPERMRMSGDLGFFPAMGYQGDYPQTGKEAEIIPFGMPNPLQRSRGTISTIGLGGGTMAGFYLPKDADPEIIGRRYGGIKALETFGMPKAGAVMFFNSPEYRSLLEKQQGRDRTGQEAVSETINHELLHRGASDVLPMAELAEFAEEKIFFPADHDRAVKVFENMQSVDGQHSYTDALKKLSAS